MLDLTMESWEESTPVVAELPEIKLFGKWSTEDVQVSDISLTVSTCIFFNRKMLLIKSDMLNFCFFTGHYLIVLES